MSRKMIIHLDTIEDQLKLQIEHDPPIQASLPDKEQEWAARIEEVLHSVLRANDRIQEQKKAGIITPNI